MKIAVEFHEYEKLNYYETPLKLKPDDWVVARTVRGIQLGKTVEAPARLEGDSPFPVLERKATSDDLRTHYRNRLRCAEALMMGRARVADRNLSMHFLAAELTLDGDRLIFYFHAEERVDFRMLLKDLATAFHKRIELYQINARERAKLVGGLGPCGRVCCCTSWLREFTPVSVKLAKEQGSSLNPQKISGACGRLMCCLRYEYETYLALRRELPKVGSSVRIPEGKAQVLEVHPIKRTLVVALPNREPMEIPVGRAVDEKGEVCGSCKSSRCRDDDVSKAVN